MRDVIRLVVDDGEFLEVHEHYAKNIVCGFSRLDGYASASSATSRRTSRACSTSTRAARPRRFVRTCDAFNIPILTFMRRPRLPPRHEPGVGRDHHARREAALRVHRGDGPEDHRHHAQGVRRRVRRHGAPSTCSPTSTSPGRRPRSRSWGRRARSTSSTAATSRSRRRPTSGGTKLIDDYKARFANPYTAAERGYVDDVITPSETRPKVITALHTLLTKREPGRSASTGTSRCDHAERSSSPPRVARSSPPPPAQRLRGHGPDRRARRHEGRPAQRRQAAHRARATARSSDVDIHFPPGLVGDPQRDASAARSPSSRATAARPTRRSARATTEATAARPAPDARRARSTTSQPRGNEPALLGHRHRHRRAARSASSRRSPRARATAASTPRSATSRTRSWGCRSPSPRSRRRCSARRPTGRSFMQNPTSCGTAETVVDATLLRRRDRPGPRRASSRSSAGTLPFAPTFEATVGAAGENAAARPPAADDRRRPEPGRGERQARLGDAAERHRDRRADRLGARVPAGPSSTPAPARPRRRSAPRRRSRRCSPPRSPAPVAFVAAGSAARARPRACAGR